MTIEEEYDDNLIKHLDEMIWKPTPNYEGLYESSNWGLEKSLDRYVKNSYGNGLKKIKGRILKPKLNKDGYLLINLCKNGIGKWYLLSRIICETFNGSCPIGFECRHLDNNKINNHINNLCWSTHKENEKDKIKFGTIVSGEKQGSHKLTQRQVEEIRKLYKTGDYLQRQLGKMFNMSQTQIGNIVRYEQWNY